MEKTIVATKPARRSLLQSLIRAIVPTDLRFYDVLERQAEILCEAAAKLSELSTRDVPTVVREIQELEHAGDAREHQLVEMLAKTFVTPLDREDLKELSSQLDSVLDDANRAARSCQMCGVDRPTPAMNAMIGLLGQMADILHVAVTNLRRHDFAAITALAHQVSSLESQGDVHHREATTALFHGSDPMQLLREKEVLDYLETALNCAEDFGDMLVVLAVKHG